VPLVLGGGVIGCALATLGLTMITGSFRPERSAPPTRLTTDIAEGLRYLWRHGAVRTWRTWSASPTWPAPPRGPCSSSTPSLPEPMDPVGARLRRAPQHVRFGGLLGSVIAAPIESRFGPVPVLFATLLILVGARDSSSMSRRSLRRRPTVASRRGLIGLGSHLG
jgi:hypothetical protein